MLRAFERKRAGEKGTHLPSASPVATFVERDAGNPRPERSIAIIAIERREAGYEGFLRQVHRLVGIADLLDDEPIDACLVPAQQFATGFLAVRAGENRPFLVATLRRSEEHTSELQSLMRISYAVFCLT